MLWVLKIIPLTLNVWEKFNEHYSVYGLGFKLSRRILNDAEKIWVLWFWVFKVPRPYLNDAGKICAILWEIRWCAVLSKRASTVA